MPQLPVAMQESAANASSENTKRDFKPLEDGVYTARLSKVDATRTQGTPSKPMWSLEFDKVKDMDGNDKPGRLWDNITIEESTDWKIAQFFDAFGVATSTNTDEMINYRCRLDVRTRVQTQGKNAGKQVNFIQRKTPLLEDDMGFEAVQKLSKSFGKPNAAPKIKAPAADDADGAEPIQDSPLGGLADDDQGVDF